MTETWDRGQPSDVQADGHQEVVGINLRALRPSPEQAVFLE